MRRSNAEWQRYRDSMGRGYIMSEPITFELANYIQAQLKPTTLETQLWL